MTFVLTITTIALCAASQHSVPGYEALDLCDAAGEKQVMQADGVQITKTYTCDQQSDGPVIDYGAVAMKWRDRRNAQQSDKEG